MRKPVRCFMDGTDWLHELGYAAQGNKLYPSQGAIKEESEHNLDECGIAEVEVKFIGWVKEPTI